MDTVQLTGILSSDPHARNCFIGVVPCNHLPTKFSKAPACLVVNTDPSWKQGAHWLAVYMDENRDLEFFDSYGQDPEQYRLVYDFLKRNGQNKWKENRKQLQGPLSSTCGQFCLYFLLWRCRGIKFEKIMSGFDESVHTNDFMVTTFVNSLLKESTKVFDVAYVINQCSRTLVPLVDLL